MTVNVIVIVTVTVTAITIMAMIGTARRTDHRMKTAGSPNYSVSSSGWLVRQLMPIPMATPTANRLTGTVNRMIDATAA